MALLSITTPSTPSTSSLLLLSALTLLIYLLLSALYTIYLHPLAAYPGPFWARLSTFPSWWASLHRERHLWLRALHTQYGPQVRYRPDAVAFNTPGAFRTLIANPKANVTKSRDYAFFARHSDAANTVQVLDNAVHARRRRVLAKAFSERALRGYEPYVLGNMDRWVELLAAEVPAAEGAWSRSVNAADWINWLVFDIMGDLCFGKPFGLKEHGSEMRHLIDLFGSTLAMMVPMSLSPIAPLWIWLKPRGLDYVLDYFLPADIIAWWRWISMALAERTHVEDAARQASGGGGGGGGGDDDDHDDDTTMRRDFFHYLFDARDPQTGRLGYTPEQLWEECQMLVGAGSDTTAIVLAGVVFYLARVENGAQARLAREVAGAFGGVGEIVPGASLQGCGYLRAVLQEGLRMTPPVAADLRREVLPGGTVVEGQFFPAGVVVSVGTYALGYNEDVFPDPYAFKPERWLVDDKAGVTQQDVEQRERALAAFSAGTRGCVGKNLGWMEMSLALAKLMYGFEIRRDPTNNLGGGRPDGRPGRRNPDQYQIHDVFLALRDGPMVQLRKRVHG